MSSYIIAGSQDAKRLQVRPFSRVPSFRTAQYGLLQDDIQTELVVRGMSEADDSTMAEYVAVMLSGFNLAVPVCNVLILVRSVNQKTAGRQSKRQGRCV